MTYPDGPMGQDGYHVGGSVGPVITDAMIERAALVIMKHSLMEFPSFVPRAFALEILTAALTPQT